MKTKMLIAAILVAFLATPALAQPTPDSEAPSGPVPAWVEGGDDGAAQPSPAATGDPGAPGSPAGAPAAEPAADGPAGGLTAAPDGEPSASPASPGEPDTAAPSDPSDDPVGTLGKLVDAIRSGHWRMAAALFLSLLMFGWNYARKEVGWLKKRLAGDRAGAISLLALAVAGGLLTALSAEAPLDAKMLIGSLWTAVEAAGLFLLLKKIWKPDKSTA